MARLPLYPRAACLLLAAEERGARAGGAALAALIGGERLGARARKRDDVDGAADVLEDLEQLRAITVRDHVDFERARHEGIDLGRLAEIDRARRQLERLLPGKTGAQHAPGSLAEEEALLRAMLTAFPDRVARRLRARAPEVAFYEGGSGRLDPSSVVRSAELLVAYDVTERTTLGGKPPPGARMADGAIVRGAARITADWLLDQVFDQLVDDIGYEWNRAAERVDEVRRLRYGALVIDETRAPARHADSEECQAAIARVLGDALDEALRTGGGKLAELREELGRALDRLAFLATALPELALPVPPRLDATEDGARESLRALFAAACHGRTSFAQLTELSAKALVGASLPAAVAARFDRDAPETIALGGRRTRIEYPRDQPPFVASRLQDFFGLAEGPKIASGRVPLTLHLLAPNKRAVQVTQDLAGFWSRHYPAIRRELSRRYPRHRWPEDPLQRIMLP